MARKIGFVTHTHTRMLYTLYICNAFYYIIITRYCIILSSSNIQRTIVSKISLRGEALEGEEMIVFSFPFTRNTHAADMHCRFQRRIYGVCVCVCVRDRSPPLRFSFFLVSVNILVYDLTNSGVFYADNPTEGIRQ